MNRSLLSLLCSCLTLGVLAVEPVLTRSQLKHIIVAKERSTDERANAAQGSSLSLQQYMQERNLTLNDNKINPGKSKGQSLKIRSGETGDVTALINALLTDDWASINVDNADCDLKETSRSVT